MKVSLSKLYSSARKIAAFFILFSPCLGYAEIFVAGLNAIDRNHYAAAYRSFKPLADEGIAEAQNNLGFLFQNGLGVRRNYNTAIKWYQSAADQGLAEAEHNLGILNYRGHGLAQSYQIARRWFKKSADKGLRDSHYMLGLMFYKGEGVKNSMKRASQHFTVAASQGDANSQYMLAHMVLTGDAESPYKHQATRSSPFDFSIFTDGSSDKMIASLSLSMLSEKSGQLLAAQLVEFTKSQLDDEQITISEELVELCISSNYKNCPIFSGAD
jgi:TPR repeat protein